METFTTQKNIQGVVKVKDAWMFTTKHNIQAVVGVKIHGNIHNTAKHTRGGNG
jgi:hypothetical protein